MTYEIKQLYQTLYSWQKMGKKAVFVSVVALEGSSYRKPGVRMIISQDGESVGAVSGGCVEKEIERQAQTVFITGKAKMMTYDGRLRIGCEGIIHILIEPVFISENLMDDFELVMKSRQNFRMDAWYYHEVGVHKNAGTLITFKEKTYSLNPFFDPMKIDDQECFSQTFKPLFQLYIFGAEHDAVQLCQAAKLLGWEITIIASADESKSCDYFPGVSTLLTPSFDEINTLEIDSETAVVLMTHSFNKDVQYLMALKNIEPAYLGIIGSVNRRERILSTLLDYFPDISPEFLEQIHSPAGVNIGAISASEIAVSVIAEILSVVRKQNRVVLREKSGAVHG